MRRVRLVRGVESSVECLFPLYCASLSRAFCLSSTFKRHKPLKAHRIP
jgi:hypothetical protein